MEDNDTDCSLDRSEHCNKFIDQSSKFVTSSTSILNEATFGEILLHWARLWENKCLSKRSLTKHTCSHLDKLTIYCEKLISHNADFIIIDYCMNFDE